MADPVVLQKYSADLHQVLKDLTGLAKLGSAPLNTYQAAVRNSDELLKQIERESTERKLLEQIERESREE
ncbi:hypothetical protein [Marinobacter algicola]|uniref:Uncharacterized protein n=1 Tax=Marinobacter algicola DG893 TaxID=443152 RepID=A6F4U0_9GAMM|nr:hypothetical protein [Marinobacter algicola]EDM46254.1 hypothetical protein MDG893_05109 [Marinobacter algicola DG893]